jgi:hypothetical protein
MEKADVGIGSAPEEASSDFSTREVRKTVWPLSVRVCVMISGSRVWSMYAVLYKIDPPSTVVYVIVAGGGVLTEMLNTVLAS